jgi:hypothetical protein
LNIRSIRSDLDRLGIGQSDPILGSLGSGPIRFELILELHMSDPIRFRPRIGSDRIPSGSARIGSDRIVCNTDVVVDNYLLKRGKFDYHAHIGLVIAAAAAKAHCTSEWICRRNCGTIGITKARQITQQVADEDGWKATKVLADYWMKKLKEPESIRQLHYTKILIAPGSDNEDSDLEKQAKPKDERYCLLLCVDFRQLQRSRSINIISKLCLIPHMLRISTVVINVRKRVVRTMNNVCQWPREYASHGFSSINKGMEHGHRCRRGNHR